MLFRNKRSILVITAIVGGIGCSQADERLYSRDEQVQSQPEEIQIEVVLKEKSEVTSASQAPQASESIMDPAATSATAVAAKPAVNMMQNCGPRMGTSCAQGQPYAGGYAGAMGGIGAGLGGPLGAGLADGAIGGMGGFGGYGPGFINPFGIPVGGPFYGPGIPFVVDDVILEDDTDHRRRNDDDDWGDNDDGDRDVKF